LALYGYGYSILVQNKMQTLIFIMSFANFVFYPLVIATIIAFIIEQIFRSQDKAPEILRSMAVRKYFWRQAWLFNIIWFLCYGILLFVMRPGQQAMPDLIWQG
tara:strand:+ start:190 stop:498 length:309 start_codon:yes stop_codon:yes gene_type:complete